MKVRTCEQKGHNMSFLEEFVKALVKADKEQSDTQTEVQTQTQTQTEVTTNTQTQTVNYESELDKLKRENAELMKQLQEAQVANRTLLNNTSVANSNTSFSDIMREQNYHPLAKRGE